MGIGSVHQAVSANNLKCLSTLVKHGAYVTRTDKRGLLPIDVAKVCLLAVSYADLKLSIILTFQRLVKKLGHED